MGQRKYTKEPLDDALSLVSKGYTYAEVAIRSGMPYWVISGSIRKIAVPMLYEEKDRVEEFARENQTTAPEIVMDIVNHYWDDYVKKYKALKAKKKR